MQRSLPSTRALRCAGKICIAKKGGVDNIWRCYVDGDVLVLSSNFGTVNEVKENEESERTRDGDLPYPRGLGV